MPHLNSVKTIGLWMITGLLLLAGCNSRSEPTRLPSTTQEIPPTITAVAYSTDQDEDITQTPEEEKEDDIPEQDQVDEEMEIHADVISVKTSGSSNTYQFSVEISSPDTGCEQYADWWEVLSEDGELIYRRILLHSHVNDQPFTRSGGPVNIGEDTIVIIRAHMNITGYGGAVITGSIKSGFVYTDLPIDFSPEVEKLAPLPSGCNF